MSLIEAQCAMCRLIELTSQKMIFRGKVILFTSQRESRGLIEAFGGAQQALSLIYSDNLQLLVVQTTCDQPDIDYQQRGTQMHSPRIVRYMCDPRVIDYPRSEPIPVQPSFHHPGIIRSPVARGNATGFSRRDQ